MKIKFAKNPVTLVTGFLLLFFLTACLSPKTPDEVTLAFWSAMAKNDLVQAKKYCHSQSQHLLSNQSTQLEGLSFSYGRIVIEADRATVETKITPSTHKNSSFTTFLVKQDDQWKVDYQRSVRDLAGNQLFKDFFDQLNILGESFNRQLEQQLPIIEKGIESFGQELKQQLDQLGDELKKSFPEQKQQKPYQDAI